MVITENTIMITIHKRNENNDPVEFGTVRYRKEDQTWYGSDGARLPHSDMIKAVQAADANPNCMVTFLDSGNDEEPPKKATKKK